MNKTKQKINIIIEILLIFSIIIAVLAIFVKGTVLNKNTYINILDKNNTYAQIKESIIEKDIITEEYIKKEADNMISGLIYYLETGDDTTQLLDTKSTENDLSYNNNLQLENVVYTQNKTKTNNDMLVKDGSDKIKVEKLMTKSEAEDKVKEILKKKGLTEEQAIQKAMEKGITEEQAMKMLADYGITIDGKSDSEGNKSASENPDNSNNNSSDQGGDNTTKNSGKEASSNNQTEDSINHMGIDNNIKSKLDRIAKITSIIYKMFWIFMALPIILMAILIKINGKDFYNSLKYVRNAFLFAGVILFAGILGTYVLKGHLNINIVYLKDVINLIINKFLTMLSIYAIATLIIGIFLLIPKIKKIQLNNIKQYLL